MGLRMLVAGGPKVLMPCVVIPPTPCPSPHLQPSSHGVLPTGQRVSHRRWAHDTLDFATLGAGVGQPWELSALNQ